MAREDLDTLKRYVHLTEGFEDATIPTSNSPTNGSIPGMLRVLGGEAATDFQKMACAVQTWLVDNKE